MAGVLARRLAAKRLRRTLEQWRATSRIQRLLRRAMSLSPGSRPDRSRPSVSPSAPSTRKFPSISDGHSVVAYKGEPGKGRCGIRALLEGMRADLGWAAICDGPNIIGLLSGEGRRRDLARARRPVRAFRRASRDDPRDRGRTRRPFQKRKKLRRGLRDWLPDARHEPEAPARRNPDDAETALRHHGEIYAESRLSRPRHDVPHGDRADQSRFLQRSRHGEEAARLAGAAAGRDRAVRQFPFYRRQAQRLSLGAVRGLARHRSGAHRNAAFRLRARNGL